jgi:1-pyrroline-5-carboxylate dehydrogenase
MAFLIDFKVFMSSVIDHRAFNKIKSYIDYTKQSRDAEIIAGGECESLGLFQQD